MMSSKASKQPTRCEHGKMTMLTLVVQCLANKPQQVLSPMLTGFQPLS